MLVPAKAVLLSAILSCLYISTCTSQYTTTYYVTPNASTTPCSDHDPCYEFKTYYQNSSYYFQSNTQFIFLPGVHVFDLGGLLSVRDIDNISLVGSDNLTLHTVAEKVKEYGFDSYDEDDVITYFESSTKIKCSNQSGFVFSKISNLAIANLSMVSCGQYSSLTSFTAALHMFNIINLSMEGVSIQNSSGYGMLGVNILGYSQITKSSFIANNQYVKDMLIKMYVGDSQYHNTAYVNNGSVPCGSSGGGNLFLQYSTVTEPPELKLSNLLITLGVDGSFTINPSISCGGYGTGLSIYSDYNEQFTLGAGVEKSVFYRNQAFWGANLYAQFNANMYAVAIKNIHNMRGVAAAGGAGVKAFVDELIGGISYFNVTDSVFECNYVTQELGSSIDVQYLPSSVITGTISIQLNNCTFKSDSGFSVINVAASQFLGEVANNIVLRVANSAFYPAVCTYSIVVNTSYVVGNYTIYFTNLDVNGNDVLFISTNAVINNCNFTSSKVTGVNSTITLHGLVVFSNSSDDTNGGALYLAATAVVVEANSQIYFLNNNALYGGAIYIDFLSELIFISPCNVSFINNDALISGGAIYVQRTPQTSQAALLPPCFFKVNNTNNPFYSTTIRVQLYFEGNSAGYVSSVLYGGNIDNCVMDCTMLQLFYQLQCNSSAIFDAIIKYGSNNSNPRISSDPTSVCPCEGCSSSTSMNITVYPGQVISIPFITVGQRNSIASSIVIFYTTFPAIKIINSLRTEKYCANYSIPFEIANQTLLVSTEDGILSYQYKIEIFITVLLPCPTGFVLMNNSCTCNDLLQGHGFTCYISNQTAQQTGNQWVGYTSNGGLAVSDVCPFDYCTNEIIINLTDLNGQCNYNRSNILCGQCPQGLSMTLGTSQCMKCSHYHLFLIIPFALMGLALVIVLFALNLTVSAGTLNGMIFYANTFRINDSIFFPVSERSPFVQFLSAAIAWFNLDVGIETCFYDGMKGYGKTWLQFVFPVYLFSLVLMIIIAGRYSSRISKLCRFNAVPVLATLILLSYSKVLRTTITIFSSASLETENSSDNQLVWLYDGNVEYYGPAHTVLFLFGLLVLIFFISPYTILLLLAPCLQARSHWRCLHWINKIKPFLDCYQAPFKDKYRFWSGMLLLGCLPLYVLFVLENDPTSKLLGILVFIYLYLIIISGLSVYKNWLLLLLEMLFLVNMTAVTEAMLLSTNRAIYSITGAIVYLLSVCGVVIFHIYHQCKRISWVWPKKVSKSDRMAPASEIQPLNYDISNDTNNAYGSTEQFREPLLEDSYT